MSQPTTFSAEHFGDFFKDQIEKEQLTAVKHYGLALGYVPSEMKTEEICFTAVKKNGMALMCVPNHLKTRQMCLTAVEQDEGALKFVPEEIRDEIVTLSTS